MLFSQIHFQPLASSETICVDAVRYGLKYYQSNELHLDRWRKKIHG